MDLALAGRDPELRLLRGWIDDAGSGRGRIVQISGEAGVGKTSLVASVADEARALGLRMLVGRTTEADGAPPNWPWLQILDRLGARSMLEGPAGSDPDSEQFTRLEAVVAVLVSEPSVIVVEDAHRADPASLRLLVRLAEAVGDAPVALLVTQRSEPVDRTPGFDAVGDQLGRAAGACRLDLAGVDRATVATLLPSGLDEATVEAVWSVSNGNPLLVGELGRHLAGGATLATVPRSVRDAVGLRLARRTPACVELVRFAAVAGRTFRAGLLATVTGRPAIQVLTDLDEAVAASLVEPTGEAGVFRFVHAVVREAVLATLGAAERAAHHLDLAAAVETYEADSEARTLELARLWDAASPLGDHGTAAQWCTRAATVAERQLAWEDAARFYQRAIDLAAGQPTPIDDFDRNLGAARALSHCGELTAVHAHCVRAAAIARQADRPDLVADAVLVLEGRGGPTEGLQEAAQTALDALPPDAHHLRARLHAQLVNMAFYVEPTAMEAQCAAAEANAALAGDPVAELAALRARNMLSYGPEHASRRLDLADRLEGAAAAARKPSVGFWAPLWRIDALVELGRLPEAIAAVADLRRAVRAAGLPIARWHQARTEAALAQATARFDDAHALAIEARDLFAQFEGSLGATAMYLGVRIGIEMHTGHTPETTDAWRGVDVDSVAPFLGDLPLLGSANVALAAGDREEALRCYRRLPAAAGWRLPPAISLQMLTLRVQAAVGLGVVADLPALYEALLVHRRLHVGSGGGIVNYLGPVELWLGITAARREQFDAAVDHLTAAAEAATAAGAPGFAVQARTELAETLVARGGPGDRNRAAALAAAVRPEAERLGMAPFAARIERLAGTDPPRGGVLSPRELEVAALVAHGKTNREIATALYISERTAQNHVQHILTKLGLDNRTQVAAWHTAQRR
ncbi:MAG: LuxR C-terminal-related transcriptional regulator [Acidimicrobiales bacterium]